MTLLCLLPLVAPGMLISIAWCWHVLWCVFVSGSAKKLEVVDGNMILYRVLALVLTEKILRDGCGQPPPPNCESHP